MRNLFCLLMATLGLIPIVSAQGVPYPNVWNVGPYPGAAGYGYAPVQAGYAVQAYPQTGYPAEAYPQAMNVQAAYGQPVYEAGIYTQPQGGAPGVNGYPAGAEYLHAPAPCSSANCGHCCPSHCSRGGCLHRSGMFAEFLYWRATGAEISFAVVQDGIGPPGTVPLSEVAVLEYDYEPCFRAGGTLALNCESSVSVSMTKFETHDSAALVAPAPLVIQPLVTFPGTVNAGFTSQVAAADTSLELDLIDVEYRAVLVSCSRYFVNGMIGARYAELDQSFGAVFPFANPDGTTVVLTDLDFEGFGIRLGLDGESFLWRRLGISVYGKATGGVLGGEFSGYYAQRNQFNGFEAFTAWEDDRLVPMADLELGLRWSSPKERIKLSAGYYVGIWDNVVTTSEWINGVQRFNFVDIGHDSQDTLRFDGLVARAEVRL